MGRLWEDKSRMTADREARSPNARFELPWPINRIEELI